MTTAATCAAVLILLYFSSSLEPSTLLFSWRSTNDGAARPCLCDVLAAETYARSVIADHCAGCYFCARQLFHSTGKQSFVGEAALGEGASTHKHQTVIGLNTAFFFFYLLCSLAASIQSHRLRDSPQR